jgi:aryl-alcohol dehydrogenase-like predicted oxidoreductase
MRFRRLGRTGLQVSEIGFGSLEIGRDWGVVPTDRGKPQEAESIQLLEAAITLGINFVDTAMAYVKSEERIGKAISSGRLRRESFYLATKAGERFDEATGSLYDYSYAGITRSIMESLERLQVDRVEGLQLHTAPLEVVRMGDAIRALQDLRRAGQCDFVGASFSSEQACAEAIKSGDYDTIQITYNLLERSAAERLLALAQEADLGVIVKLPLAKGMLSTKLELLSPAEQAKVAPYRFLEREGHTLSQAALRFVLSHPAVSTVLSGTRRVEHLRTNIAAADGQGLPAADLVRIRAIPEVPRP